MNNETKHTPGPWTAVSAPTASQDSRWIYGEGREHPVCCIPWQGEQAERLANAELIAAAPETAAERDRLREACSYAVTDYETAGCDGCGTITDKAHRMLKAALAGQPSTVDPQTLPGLLAEKFSELLREELGDERLKEVCARNLVEGNPNICHSHDFTDANQIMLDAEKAIGLPEGHNSIRTQLVNEAWNMAKRASFYRGWPTPKAQPVFAPLPPAKPAVVITIDGGCLASVTVSEPVDVHVFELAVTYDVIRQEVEKQRQFSKKAKAKRKGK